MVLLAACGDSTSTPDGGGSDGGADGSGGDSSIVRDGGGMDSGPVLVCGDLTCAEGETCDSCEVDCGACEEPVVTECNDGIDNDGDGLVDWQMDVGCWSSSDTTEAARPRAEESGLLTFDPGPDTRIVYVSSSEGDDANDGSSPALAVATPARGAELVRDG